MTLTGPPRTDEIIQETVDGLSEVLSRPVLLDDGWLAPIAYSRQWGDIDSVRAQSILGKGAPEEVKDALFSRGIDAVQDWIRIESDPDIGMDGRVCVPVRNDRRLLGYVWVIDASQDLSPEQLDAAVEAASSLARVLAGSYRVNRDHGELIQDLCSDDPRVSEKARSHSVMQAPLAGELLIVNLIDGDDPSVDLMDLVGRIGRRLSWCVTGRLGEGFALVLSHRDPAIWNVADSDVASWVGSALPEDFRVGQSSPATAADLATALRQASSSLRIATRGRQFRCVAWSTAGADRLIVRFPVDIANEIPERLLDFLRHEEQLGETLETFLNLAGDIKRTAEMLSLHRSGVYYRLGRIEDLTGLDLSDGEDRLMAQLAIRCLKLGLLGFPPEEKPYLA